MVRISDVFPYGCGIEDRPIMAVPIVQRRNKVKKFSKSRKNFNYIKRNEENAKKEEERIKRQLQLVAEQIRRSKEADAVKQEKECCICMDNVCNVSFSPCQHNCVCSSCSIRVSECPLCRKNIEKKTIKN